MRRKTVFTFTADLEDVRETISVCAAFHRTKRLLNRGIIYSGEEDREFDLRVALQNLVERHRHRGAFRLRNAVLTVTKFCGNGPRSRCVDPSKSACSDYFARVIAQDATLAEMELFRRRLEWCDL
jgi:hypothetical protein